LDKNNISVIPNGVSKEYLNLRNGELFRRTYNLKEKDFVVLSLSRIHKSKGLDLPIKIAQDFPKVKFIIAGADSGYLSELKKLKEDLKANNVSFIGGISDDLKLSALSACDVFLFPSHYEGFGIVVLEAFSQRVCVLSSDAGALSWVVDNSGMLFKDNNLEDLKNKLELLIKNNKLRNKYSKLGYERVKDFTWEKIADKLEDEYKRL